MRRVLLQVAPILRLTRVTTAFAAVGNVWFVILWTRANPLEAAPAPLLERPLWLLLLGGAVTALGFYAYGVCLNDTLDIHRDRALRLARPLPEGRVSPEAAVVSVACTLTAAVLGATVFGTAGVVLTLVLAMAALVFNALGKFIPAIGLVLLGLIYAGHMLVPNLWLRFLLPVWLVMTHALVLAGVTHHLARKSPPITRRAVGFAAAGWLFWSAVLLAAGWWRTRNGPLWPEWVSPTAWVWPALLVLLFVALAARRVRSVGPGPRAAEKVTRYGALWLALYGCAWLYGDGHTEAGLIMTALAAAGFLGMTVLREIYDLLEHPVGYRR